MDIKEAIEILGELFDYVKPEATTKGEDAIKLGIEALNRLQERRGFAVPADLKLLLGETLSTHKGVNK